MSGTVRTISYLLTSEFQDGQAPGSITPSRQRDFVATVQAVSGTVYTPEQYGAAADGSTDDTTAIQNAINAVSSSGGGIVLFSRGKTYAYSNILTAAAECVLMGYGATLSNITTGNTGNANRAIHLNGTGACVLGLTLTAPTYTSAGRLGTDQAQGIWLDSGFTQNLVRDCWIYGGAAGGIFNNGASYGWIINNRVDSTAADGIHNTNGSNHMLVQGNFVYNPGDDGLVSLTYNTDSTVCHHNSFIGNQVVNGQARGCAIIGCTDILVSNNVILFSQDPSIYVASETTATNVARVKVIGNYCQQGNQNGTYLGDIAIIPNAVVSGTTATDISIVGNFIYESNGPAITIYGNGTTIGAFGINICGNHITGPTGNGIDLEPTMTTGCLIDGNYVKAAGDVGVYVAAGNTGIKVSNNFCDGVTTYAVQVMCPQAMIVGNQCIGTLTNGLYLGSGNANCVVTGNQWSGSGQNLNGNTVVTNR